MLARRVFVSRVLQVVRQNHGRDPAPADRDADSPIDQMADLRGGRRLLHEGARDILV